MWYLMKRDLHLPAAQLTPSAKALQQFGYSEPTDLIQNDQPTGTLQGIAAVDTADTTNGKGFDDTKKDPTSTLQVKCLSLHSTIPTRATEGLCRI